MDEIFLQSLGRSWDARSSDSSRPGTHVPDTDQVQGSYRVRFARNDDDLDATCKLRFEVFNVELREGLEESFATGRDRDGFDELCQHVLVEHERDGVIGTYRLLLPELAAAGSGFYAATEFDLASIPADILAASVEAGRACIALEHRNRPVLAMLWRGLLAHVIWNRKRYFFGCSSLTSQDEVEGSRVYRWLKTRGFVSEELEVRPLVTHRCAPYVGPVPQNVHIPKLFRTYLRHGAKICSTPAIDRAFKTIDYLTFVDVARVDPKTIKTIGG